MSDYLGRTWDFLKWHKKKFIALGSVTALGVGGYYYAKRMVLDGMRQVEELGRGLQEKMMETQYRESELARVRAECGSMILTFVPPLRNMVKKLTDPKPVTERLKAVRLKRKNEGMPSAQDEEEVMQLWDELKVISLARLIVSIYALGLLNCVLRIQLHILGRYAFEEAISQRRAEAAASSETADAAGVKQLEAGVEGAASASHVSEESTGLVSQRLRESFLFSGSDHFMNSGSGMETMLYHIQESIQRATKDWHMGTDATVNRWDILNMIDKIREEVEGRGTDGAEGGLRLSEVTRSWIVKCLVPEDEEGVLSPDPDLNDEQNAMLRDMLEETLDMIESPNFALSAEQTFDRLFDALHKLVQNRPFEVYRRGGAGGGAKSTTPKPVAKDAAPQDTTGGEGAQTSPSSSTEKSADTPATENNEDNEDRFSLTKIIVNLKVASGQVLEENALRAPGTPPADGFASGDEAPAPPRSEFQQALSQVPALDDLCNAVFQQGTDEDSSLDDLGLGALGLGDGGLGGLASLLGGLDGGAGGDGDMNEAELMKMLTQGLMGGPGGPGGIGGGFGSGSPSSGSSGMDGDFNEAQLMQMFQAMAAQGFDPNATPGGVANSGNNTNSGKTTTLQS
ncbi:Peroxisomal biosis factor 3 [Hondaea fermentalgiana]|uniref:Peroxisomal biosis factor 3 n=1 Tax=Hondaea fermentalgiana TaxID=2315210 RepID=A0A2R5G1R0_9STRA|nr:Peroxisomal biosis factor 3 [Hondaea fermentalgiana]|eukprot:GBG24957.1 Peroxisomal biosis factor 3 [Hondaea fermentalgiana]